MILLTSGELRVYEIIKPTKAKFFQDWREGDSVEFFHKLKNTTGASSGLYATEFEVKNYTRGTSTRISGNNLVARLDNFRLRKL